MSRRVLVVNDIGLVAELVRRQLLGLGFTEIHLAGNGFEALQLLESARPDLVISDINMPVLDGYQICRLMQSPEMPHLNDIPVVLMSSTYRDLAAARLAMEVGARAFLQWPATPDELLAAIHQALAEPGAGRRETPRILVADDDDIIRESLTIVLRDEGYEVLGVGSGQEAIVAADAWSPDLVLADYMMPNGDGGEVVDWYRQHLPETPVVILTAHGSERLAVDLMRRGAHDYLPKPFDLDVVLPLVRRALEKRNLRGISRQFQEMMVSLRRAEARYRTLFEGAGDPIFLCDQRGQILELNRRATQLLAEPSERVTGRSIQEVLSPGSVLPGRNVLQGLERWGTAGMEAVLHTADRGPIPVEVSGARVVVDGQDRWLIAARDLSDRLWIGTFVRNEHEFLKHLYRETPLIDGESGLAGFLNRALLSVLQVLRADAGVVFAAPWGQEEFDLRHGVPLTTRWGVAPGLVEQVRRVLAGRHGGRDEPYERFVQGPQLLDLEHEQRFTGRLEVELATQDRQLGFLVLWRRDGIKPHDRDRMLARAISSHLAQALANASLLARVSQAQDDWVRTFDAVTEMTCLVDSGGRVVRANRALAERVSTEVESLVGADARALLLGQSSPSEKDPLALAQRQRSPAQSEGALPGLGPGLYVLTASPLFSEEGAFRGAVLVARDVTNERRAQQQLLISEKMSTIGRVAAGVTHEINNPTAFVLLNLMRVQENLKTLSDVLDEYRATVRELGGEEASGRMEAREAELGAREALDESVALNGDSLDGMRRIRDIVQDLRVFSHMRAEQSRHVDLNKVVDSAILMARHEIRHRARLVRDLEPVAPCAGMPTRLGQVVLNLLVNAAQAIDEGKADENEVRVRTRERDGWVFVEVEDTGCGIPPEEQSRIFDPFFTTKAPGEGTGLGLSLCFEIVTRHAGEITVTSAPGRGSTFRVALPVAAAEETDHVVEVPALSGPPARMLVIEDELPLHRAIGAILGGHDLHFAATGREGLAILERDRSWDVILCDVVMADVTGVEVFDRIRRDWPELESRVAFITGGIRSERSEAALRRSGRPVLEKPVEPHALHDLVQMFRSTG